MPEDIPSRPSDGAAGWAPPGTPRGWILLSLAFLVAFGLTDVATERVSGSLEVSLWFPPVGLSMALALVTGTRAFPLIFIAAAAHIALYRSTEPWLVVALALVAAATYVGAARVVLRRAPTQRLRGLAEVAWFVGVLCVAAPLLVAVLAALGYSTVGLIEPGEIAENIAGALAGDGSGVAVVVPLVALVLHRRDQRLRGASRSRLWGTVPGFVFPGSRRGIELLTQGLLLAVALYLAYGMRRGVAVELAYLAFVPLVWIAVRDTFEQAIIAVSAYNVSAVLLVSVSSATADPILLQFSLLVATLLTLVLSASTSEYRRSRTHLAGSEARFRAVTEHSSEVIKIVEQDGTLRFASEAFGRIFGHDPVASVGLNVLEWVHPDDLAAVAAETERALASGPGAHSRAEYRFRHAAGHWIPVESMATYLLEDPAVRGVVMHVRDISERRRHERQLTHQAYHDELTGLPNRALLVDRLEHALARDERSGDGLAVLFFDLDDFKDVNDSLGHEAGDELLRGFARRLADGLRPGDTLARLGGDEFCLLAEGAGAEAAGALAARALESIAAEGFSVAPEDPGRLRVGVSIGIATAQGGTPSSGELLKRADLAMYRAKRTGGARMARFEAGMATDADARLTLRQELASALDRDEFEVHFQPQICLETGAVLWMEALVRWRHPRRGLIGPNEFIPTAEQTGQIDRLGAKVLTIALAEQSRWEQADGTPPPGVSVNLSGHQLRDLHIVEQVMAALEAASSTPDALALELTESVFSQDEQSLIALRRLNDAGVQICIDDFGTGFSSLAALRSLPAQTLKIDGSFLADVDRDSVAGVTVAAIASLAAAAGMTVVAECIERAPQRTIARTAGCDLGQGYLFARPMPAQDVPSFLREYRCSAPEARDAGPQSNP